MIKRPEDKMDNKILNDLKNQAYITACDHGFHDKEHSDSHFLMLVITELAEAVEADRKGKYADINGFKFASSVMNKGRRVHSDIEVYNDYIKGTVEEELADAVIRLLDLAGLRDIELNIGDKTMFFMIIDFCFKYFPESILKICMFPAIIYQLDARSDKEKTSNIVHAMIASIFALAEYKDIDLSMHVKMKMKYNQTRERLHGKLY